MTKRLALLVEEIPKGIDARRLCNALQVQLGVQVVIAETGLRMQPHVVVLDEYERQAPVPPAPEVARAMYEAALDRASFVDSLA